MSPLLPDGILFGPGFDLKILNSSKPPFKKWLKPFIPSVNECSFLKMLEILTKAFIASTALLFRKPHI